MALGMVVVPGPRRRGVFHARRAGTHAGVARREARGTRRAMGPCMSTFKNVGKTGPRRFVLGAIGACALGVVVSACSSAPGTEDGASGATSESAAVTSDATTTGIASLALANRGKGACSTNSRGGHDFDTSCTGNGDRPEFWCADFARWVWD